MFIDNLIDRIKEKNSPICVGLDPRIERLPEEIKQKTVNSTKAIFEFNKSVIDVASKFVPAVKLQIAFYEFYKDEGIRLFFNTAEYAKEKGLFVIADVKRSDIGEVAKKYSETYLHPECIDAITVNPYLGRDAIAPFVEDATKLKKGVFVLVKTSNKGSDDIQNLSVDGSPLYERVAKMVCKLGEKCIGRYGYSCIGAVIGATHRKEALNMRRKFPHLFFLVPGYGAQGAGPEDVVTCFNEDGTGAIINSSRSIIFAFEGKKTPYQKAIEEAILNMRSAIWKEAKQIGKNR